MGLSPLIVVGQDDTLPPLTVTLTDLNNNPINLSTATSVMFQLGSAFTGTIVNSPVTITDAVHGKVTYTWSPQDTLTPGVYSIEWVVTWGNSTQSSYPIHGYQYITIMNNLAIGYPNVSATFNTIWSSSSAPISANGNNGDFWYNTSNNYFYGPKANGSWPAGFSINPSGYTLDHMNVNPSSTAQVGLTVNNPSGTSVDVAQFQINGTPYWRVTSAGKLIGVAEADATVFAASGLTGAQIASRYVGATSGGAPVSGTFAVGDFVIDTVNGTVIVCTTAGSPGTWVTLINTISNQTVGGNKTFTGSTSVAALSASGEITSSTAGIGVTLTEGTNARMGTAVLNGTTAVVVSTTAVTSKSRIFLTIQTPGGTPASPYVSAMIPGTSFNVKSTGASDTSTVAWLIVNHT
jgi:hypothetical protein